MWPQSATLFTARIFQNRSYAPRSQTALKQWRAVLAIVFGFVLVNLLEWLKDLASFLNQSMANSLIAFRALMLRLKTRKVS